MVYYKVRKRNGSIVTFEAKKIEQAIQKAIVSVEQHWDISTEKILGTFEKLLEKKVGDSIPEVEQIQDVIEEALIMEGLPSVAKSFILYREKRSLERKKKNVVIEVGKSIEEYLEKSDWRVNANANSGYSLGWMILNTAGKVTANYWLSHIYPEEIWNLHRNADFHIHDLDMFCGYCAGWSLRQLLEEWFNGSDNRVDSSPAKNLQAAVNQMINFLWTLQNEWAGAQAFSSFDTYLAPFVHKYEQEVLAELEAVQANFETPEKRQEFIDKKVYKYVYQQMQNFVFWLNVPSRWGTQTPFTNITLDWTCPEDLKEKSLFLWWMDVGYYEKKFWELEHEMKIINRALIEVYVKGDRKGRVFTFPIPTYNITEDFPWNDPDIDALFEMTAKYWLPYFQNFLGTQFTKEKKEDGTFEKVPNPKAYKPGAVRSMCCRLQLDLTELQKRGNGLFGSAEMTGSIWVVTLNIARLGYTYAEDFEWFIERILYLMQQAKISLELKRKTITHWLQAGLYPYTYRYLKSYRNHFSTIGLNGMNEAILNFTKGKEDISSEWGIEFANKVLDRMREELTAFQEESGNLYNLEATPAEWTTYRFAKEDKKQLPNIIQSGNSYAPYYTNSSQLPVGYTDDPFEALDKQNDLQCKYTWGTVFHMYLGERVVDAQSCKTFVQRVLSQYQIPYLTITPTFSICPKHGYIVWEHDFCPLCDADIWYTWEACDHETREVFASKCS